MFPKALNGCPKCNKLSNLVTLIKMLIRGKGVEKGRKTQTHTERERERDRETESYKAERETEKIGKK